MEHLPRPRPRTRTEDLLGQIDRRCGQLYPVNAGNRHPEMGPMTLEKTLALYAWHGPHHVAHITELRKRMSW